MINHLTAGEYRANVSRAFTNVLDEILQNGASHRQLEEVKKELSLLIDVVDFLDKRIGETNVKGYNPEKTPNHTTIGDLMK